MLKMVLKDWRANWKEGVKRGTKRIGLWALWGWICFLPDEWAKGFAMYGQFIFVIALYFLHSMYPNRLSKAMFLVPVERQEKEMYLRTNYLLKLILLEFLHCIVTLVCVFYGELAIESGILILITGIIWNLDVGIEIVGKEKAMVSHGVLQVMSAFFINLFVEEWNSARAWKWSFEFGIMVAVFLVFHVLLLVRIFRKEYQDNLNLSCDYEEDYVIRQNDGKEWWQYEDYH